MTAMALRPVQIILALLLLVLQACLWLGDGSLSQYLQINQNIERQRLENSESRIRNDTLAAAVVALQWDDKSYGEIEGLAREELGMIRRGETFFLYPGLTYVLD